MERQKNCLEVFKYIMSSHLALSVQLPGDLRLDLSELKVRNVSYNASAEIKITVEIDFALQQDAKRKNNGVFKGELVGHFELPPLLPNNKPAPNSLISTVADTSTTPCDKCSETSSTPLLAPHPQRPSTPPRGRLECRPSSAVPHRRSVSWIPYPSRSTPSKPLVLLSMCKLEYDSAICTVQSAHFHPDQCLGHFSLPLLRVTHFHPIC